MILITFAEPTPGNRVVMFNCESTAESIKSATGASDVFCLDGKK